MPSTILMNLRTFLNLLFAPSEGAWICTGAAEFARSLFSQFVITDSYPTSPFTIFEPQNPWIDEFYVVQERRATDLKAPKS